MVFVYLLHFHKKITMRWKKDFCMFRHEFLFVLFIFVCFEYFETVTHFTKLFVQMFWSHIKVNFSGHVMYNEVKKLQTLSSVTPWHMLS